jgi:dipeptidyl-peptidase 4
MQTIFKSLITFLLVCACASYSFAQGNLKWAADGNSYFLEEGGEVVRYAMPTLSKNIIVKKEGLKSSTTGGSLAIHDFIVSADETKVLIYTNSKKVWRRNTRGDYWLFDLTNGKLKQLGSKKPVSSMMFAKFSPDGKKVAYVSEYNLYMEDIVTGAIKALTKDGNRKVINGTFDWAYEEEFACRDGFRWSPDSKQIAFWQIDARGTKDYLMMNNTDSIYPKVIPVEYPVAGELPSKYKIGVVEINTSKTMWMKIPDDVIFRTYVPRMEWAVNNTSLIIQHLNRK